MNSLIAAPELPEPSDLVVRSLGDLERSALTYGVPVEDALLIAVNLFGISSDHRERNRARVHLRLMRDPARPWQVIVPLNRPASPFLLQGEDLSLGGKVVAQVERIDADEAVGGYFRDHGRAVTLNPNARSRCVGCAFCPNTLEAAADPRMDEERELGELLAALAEAHPSKDLGVLGEVTVSTGCFRREQAAVDHLEALRSALRLAGAGGARIGMLTSVLRSTEAFEALARTVAPFVLRLTVECFTRRPMMLKSTKADLVPGAMPGLLARARRAGLETSYTYIVGLDPLPEMVRGVTALAEQVSAFPNFQVFQAHNVLMAGLRTAGAESLDFYLAARAAIETVMRPTGLVPVGWECYRPLWYFTYAGQAL